MFFQLAHDETRLNAASKLVAFRLLKATAASQKLIIAVDPVHTYFTGYCLHELGALRRQRTHKQRVYRM